MKKKMIAFMCMLGLCGALFTGCGNTELWGVTFVTSDTKNGTDDVPDKEHGRTYHGQWHVSCQRGM